MTKRRGFEKLVGNRDPSIFTGVLGLIFASVLLLFAGVGVAHLLSGEPQGSAVMVTIIGGLGGLLTGASGVAHIFYSLKRKAGEPIPDAESDSE